MPSKTKKHSKTASSKLSHSDQTSPSSSSNLTPNPDVEFSEEELLSALDEASLKYPSLIGKTAVIGRVTEDLGEVVDSKGCKIWLSQSSLVASSPSLIRERKCKVVDANKLSANRNIQNLMAESSDDISRQAPELVDHVDGAFFMDHETEVYLYSPLDSALRTPEARLPHLGSECEDIKANAGVNFSKFGGLAKEYAILKDIIVSSSVEGTLSRCSLMSWMPLHLHVRMEVKSFLREWLQHC